MGDSASKVAFCLFDNGSGFQNGSDKSCLLSLFEK
jgi:hypothetical protein